MKGRGSGKEGKGGDKRHGRRDGRRDSDGEEEGMNGGEERRITIRKEEEVQGRRTEEGNR